MTTLEKIVKAAKAMKKAHPKKYAKWTDYVKAASRQIKPVKKAAPKKKIGAVKKSAPKRAYAKKCSHTDTRSHNTNIRVVSGLDVGSVKNPNVRTKKQALYAIWCEEVSGKKYFAGNHGVPKLMPKQEATKIKNLLAINKQYFKKVILKKVI